MNEDFNTNDAKWILQRTDDWIRSADAKTGAIAAIVSGVTAITLTNDKLLEAAAFAFKDPTSYIEESVLMLIAIVSLLGSFMSLLASLSPRMKNPNPSLLFFGDVAKEKDGESFAEKTSDEEYRFDIDIANQVVINSKICSKKMIWNKRAGILTTVFILSLSAFSVLTVR